MQTAIETASLQLLASPTSIVVATNLIDLETLLPHAIAQAERTGARVALVHALAVPDDVLLGGRATAAEVEIREQARQRLAAAARQFQDKGLECSIVLREGNTFEIVLEEIKASHATRLFIGTHGHGYAGQQIIGHVANCLLRTVNVPVVAIGPRAAKYATHAAPRSILHPVSLTRNYRKTADFALLLARTYDADLTLFHVADAGILRGSYSQEILARKNEELAKLIPSEYPASKVKTVVACGDLIIELMKRCSATDTDWVVVGIEHDFPWWSMSNNTAYQVIAQADRPVVTFRPQFNACEPRHAPCHSSATESEAPRREA